MTKAKKGFTLVEVILVLAIAALIFLMVLLTLPAVQRAQRDMQRKEDIGKVIAAYTEFVGNNRGSKPSATDTGVLCAGALADDNAVGNQESCELNPYVRLTADMSYTINHSLARTGSESIAYGFSDGNIEGATTDNIAVYSQARCDSTAQAVVRAQSTRQIAAVVELEGAGASGESIFYCQDS